MKGKITEKTSLGEIVEKYPKAVPVMLGKGLHCVGCYAASWETVEQGALAHGMAKKDVKKMIDEMNKAVDGKAPKKAKK